MSVTRAEPTIYVALIDMDGCALRGKNNSKENIAAWVVKQNSLLLNFLLEKIKGNQYKKVIVGAFSNRVDITKDEDNAEKNNTYTSEFVLAVIQSYLSQQLTQAGKTIEVVIDPIRPEDLYSQKQAGGSLIRQIKKKYHDIPLSSSSGLIDLHKVSLVYLFEQRSANFHPTAEIDIDIFDNNKKILTHLNEFYGNSPTNTRIGKPETGASSTSALLASLQSPLGYAKKLLSNQTEVSIYHYDGKMKPTIATTFPRGENARDHQHEWTLRYWATQTYSDSADRTSVMVATNHPMPTAFTELLKYHQQNHYDFSLQIQAEKVNVSQLLAFRDKEIPADAAPTLGKESNYINAASLCVAGLPKSYNLAKENIIHNSLTQPLITEEKLIEENETLELHQRIRVLKIDMLYCLIKIAISSYWDTKKPFLLTNQPSPPTGVTAIRQAMQICINTDNSFKNKVKNILDIDEKIIIELIDIEMKTPNAFLLAINDTDVLITNNDQYELYKEDSFTVRLSHFYLMISDFKKVHTIDINELLKNDVASNLLKEINPGPSIKTIPDLLKNMREATNITLNNCEIAVAKDTLKTNNHKNKLSK